MKDGPMSGRPSTRVTEENVVHVNFKMLIFWCIFFLKHPVH